MIQVGGRFGWEMLLLGGAVVLYIVTRWLIAMFGGKDGAAPGRQAVAQWLPIMAVALAAMGFGQPIMAAALVFGSSVACLSLVLGMTTYSAPIENLPTQRRLWALVLPPVLLLLLAGFRGHFTWYHAVMLLAMGGAILPVWLEPGMPQEIAPEPADPVGEAPMQVIPYKSGPDQSASPTAMQAVWLVPAVILLAGGVIMTQWAAMHAVTRILTPPLLAATLLSPLLLLPTLGAGTMLAHRGHADRVVTALCGTVQLNLCLLLPVLIFVGDVMCAINKNAAPLPFATVSWRVDTVLLLVLSAALIPIAAGRWIPRRMESIVLVIVYAGYLIAEISLSAGLLG